MTKIRDLGVSVIPGYRLTDPCAGASVCQQCPDPSPVSCDVSGEKDKDKDKDKDKKQQKYLGAFTDAAVMQLKQQMRQQLDHRV